MPKLDSYRLRLPAAEGLGAVTFCDPYAGASSGCVAKITLEVICLNLRDQDLNLNLRAIVRLTRL